MIEIFGCDEMIYADTRVSVRDQLELELILSQTQLAVSENAIMGAAAHSDLRLSTPDEKQKY